MCIRAYQIVVYNDLMRQIAKNSLPNSKSVESNKHMLDFDIRLFIDECTKLLTSESLLLTLYKILTKFAGALSS